jgi:hypothetical protein
MRIIGKQLVVALASAGEAVQEARGRHRQADAGLLRQEAGGRGGVAGVLLVAERDHAQAGGLRHAGEIGDRNPGHLVDVLDAVELERVDQQVEAVGRFAGLGFSRHGGCLFRRLSNADPEGSICTVALS